MEIRSLFDKRYNVKIVAYHPVESHLVNEVVYWRYKMPYRLIIKYRWYFEYLMGLHENGKAIENGTTFSWSEERKKEIE